MSLSSRVPLLSALVLGQSLMLARRLVEAGTRVVGVSFLDGHLEQEGRVVPPQLVKVRLSSAAARAAGSGHSHSPNGPGAGSPQRRMIPRDFDPSKKYPLILYIHGGGFVLGGLASDATQVIGSRAVMGIGAAIGPVQTAAQGVPWPATR